MEIKYLIEQVEKSGVAYYVSLTRKDIVELKKYGYIVYYDNIKYIIVKKERKISFSKNKYSKTGRIIINQKELECIKGDRIIIEKCKSGLIITGVDVKKIL